MYNEISFKQHRLKRANLLIYREIQHITIISRKRFCIMVFTAIEALKSPYARALSAHLDYNKVYIYYILHRHRCAYADAQPFHPSVTEKYE